MLIATAAKTLVAAVQSSPQSPPPVKMSTSGFSVTQYTAFAMPLLAEEMRWAFD